ncbi:MAG: hypothetical protein EXS55_03005 [Candidatus Magasanikbacteria bacterium]|nr:hypothetical protein [Candidatus Magasanikbacteria bacterium]
MSPLTVKHPFILTIFGASGDLAKLKIFPNLYRLAEFKRLPADYFIVGFARTQKTRAQFQTEFSESIKQAFGDEVSPEVLGELASHVYYFSGQYSEGESFKAYRNFLDTTFGKKKLPHLAYFSVPSTVYKDIIGNLALVKKPGEDLRLILEKPFGTSKQTAEELFHFASQHFAEEQFYLLDHYLGKMSVRSMLRLRESNRILSHMMRGYEIANIQITALESFGVKERASYFDQVGTIKDFIQSHMLQMLALLTMSIPIEQEAKSLQRERHAMLSSIVCVPGEKNVSIGQYESYHKEKDVPSTSITETFAAVRLFIDRLDWHRVPMYLRTGKMLSTGSTTNKKHTYAVVELKKFPFQKPAESPNRLVIELYPTEKLTITLVNKLGEIGSFQELSLSETIGCSLEEGCLPEYATLFLDILRGEKKYFLSFPEIISQWNVADQIVRSIQTKKIKLEKYADGSEGPKSQHALTAMDGFKWYDIKL